MAKVSLPTVVSPLPPDVRVFLDRVGEALRGNTFVTVDDFNAGTVPNGTGYAPGAPTTLPCGSPTNPAAPTGLTVTAGFDGFLLDWDTPAYCGHSLTEVWGRNTDDLALAIRLGATTGTTYSHLAGGPDETWYFWIRHLNVNGTAGPYNRTSGTSGTTVIPPDYLLEQLTGQITESQLYADLGSDIDALQAGQTIKLSYDGLVTGYGLAIDMQGGGTCSVGGHTTEAACLAAGGTWTPVAPISAFGVRADKFFVAGPATVAAVAPTTDNYKGRAWYCTNTHTVGDVTYTAGATYYFTGIASPLWSSSSSYANIPFIVQTSPWTDGNGVTVNPGVYMDAAYIRDATITGAKIQNVTIDSGKISSLTADKIASGSIAVGRYIQSPNFVSGTGGTGWRIETDTGGLGKAEFNTVTVRGTVYASAGTFAGSLQAATGTFAGSLSAATGTFSGALSAATGSFTGDLTGANMRATNNLYVGSGTSTSSPYLRLSGINQQLTVFDGSVNRITLGYISGSQYGLVIRNGNNQRIYSSETDVFTPYAFDSSGLGIHPGNIGTYIQPGSIDTPRLATGVVTSDKISAGAITADKIQAGAVQAGSIAAGAIIAGKIAASAVTAGNIAADSITASKIAIGAVGADELATDSVGTLKINGGAVTSMNYSNVTTNKDVYNGSTSNDVASVAITMATSGNSGVVVTATGLFRALGYTTNPLIDCTIRLLNKNLSVLSSYSLTTQGDVYQIVGFDASPSGTSTYYLSVSVSGGESSSHYIRINPVYMTATGGKR